MSRTRVVVGRRPAGGGIRVVIEGSRIADVRPHPTGTGPRIAPGLVDLQVNGYGGHDVNAAAPSAESISAITAKLANRGVTTWVPTVITGTEDEMSARIDAVTAAVRDDPAVAAAVPFVHVEGPFLSEVDGPRGVHDRSAIRPIDAEEVRRWQTHGRVGYVTLSPHHDDAAAHIARIVAGGVAVAVGHTHASPQQIGLAAAAGATLSTHLGNGISAELARHPNPIWTQLADDRLRCGLIGDGHHLSAETFTAMARALGPARAFLVSDAVELAGSPPGRHRTTVGGEVVLTEDGRLCYPDTGYLAGSAVSLADCLRWVATATAIDLAAAVRMSTATPGRIIHEITSGTFDAGRLAPGAPADLVMLGDDGTVVETIAAGETVG